MLKIGGKWGKTLEFHLAQRTLTNLDIQFCVKLCQFIVRLNNIQSSTNTFEKKLNILKNLFSESWENVLTLAVPSHTERNLLNVRNVMHI